MNVVVIDNETMVVPDTVSCNNLTSHLVLDIMGSQALKWQLVPSGKANIGQVYNNCFKNMPQEVIENETEKEEDASEAESMGNEETETTE